MSNTSDLKAPVLLIAMPQILDPFFHKSVVLLVHHDEEGSFGFIVNRPTTTRVSDILSGMEIEWHGEEDSLAYLGGPVQTELGTVLFSPHVEPAEDRSEKDRHDEFKGSTEITAENSITHHIDDLVTLAGQPPKAMRLLLGYAGWGANQLIAEILRNDWLTAPVSHDLIYCADPTTAWQEALKSVGIDADALLPWSPAMGDDGQAN